MHRLSRFGRQVRKDKRIWGQANFPFNVSLDRRVPGRLGGKYCVTDQGHNVDVVCKGCNFVKSGFPKDNFIMLLGKMAKDATVQLDAKGFLVAKPTFYKLTEADKAWLAGWARTRVETLKANHRGSWKNGDLTSAQLLKIVSSR